MSGQKKTYVQVGLGGRSSMFRDAVIGKYGEYSSLAAVCDINEGRVKLAQMAAREKGVEVDGYSAADFDRMLAEKKPDCVIVTTKDSTHAEYICRAMIAGCDVITEKPMTMDAEKCQQIIDTQKRTGRNCTVTFNYRYAAPRTQVKELLMSGVIGNVLSVDFEWLLDTKHGADYFRRWHRNKSNSGGLLVHKATHHFDLVNWWLSDVPESVYASGTRSFYTPETAARYGLTNRGTRCVECPEKSRCSFCLDIEGNEKLRQLYRECEQYDGYFRDKCVFNPENGKNFEPGVDIEDTMALVVNYAGGARLNYTLTAYSPWEGYAINFNGTAGRLQFTTCETTYVNGDGTTPGELLREGSSIKIFPHWSNAYSPELKTSKGGHGGADPVLLDYIFDPSAGEDPLMRKADQRAGAYSILCGVAGNESMRTGSVVRIDSLVQGIGRPDYPPMPTVADPLTLKPAEPASP